MTRFEKALEVLYGNSIRDLTAEGYTERLRELRKTDPALARRVERSLKPFLAKQIFRRRERKWQQTFEGTCVRLALLPDNPHLRQDVIVARSALGIPDRHVKATRNSRAQKEIRALVKPQSVRSVLEGNMAGAWHVVHCQAASGHSINAMDKGSLASSFVESAISSFSVNFKAKDIPAWLQKAPSGPAPYDSKAVPVDWAAGRLVERHHLPWHAALPLVLYIITENQGFLKNIEPLNVHFGRNGGPYDDIEAFSITIDGVDEFVSKKDWDRIQERAIKPRQLRIWERRGTRHQGRRSADISRLTHALPMYRKMVEEKKTVPELLADPYWGDQDQETVRRVLADLSDLLEPVR